MTAMKNIRVKTGTSRYEIRIGAGLLGQTGEWLAEMGFGGKAVIITDTNVAGLYGDAVSQSLTQAGFKVATLTVPAGEAQKSLEVAARLFTDLTKVQAERQTPILALGGGVVGDLAGFVAATYLRGAPLVQLPTTLLAQVDSSIGGKTAVDHGRIKNVIGVFHQPALVAADTDTLKTLPAEELTNGLAEVIKSAVIGDSRFFTYLEKNLPKTGAQDAAALEETIYRAACIKAAIVAKDERDTGLRRILNYGHTIGHALETVSDFRLRHGQAVAIGMVAAAAISRRMGVLPEGDAARLKSIIAQASLPTEAAGYNIKDILQAMKHDKKVSRDKINFVLLRAIGRAFVTDEVSPSVVEEVLGGD